MQGGNKVNHFTGLMAWKKSHNCTLQVYKITKGFPSDERFGLTSQIRRAVSSVGANIAEGYGRHHKKDKARFYHLARGSNTETQNHIILAKDLGYISEEEFTRLKVSLFESYKILCGLIKATEKNLTE